MVLQKRTRGGTVAAALYFSNDASSFTAGAALLLWMERVMGVSRAVELHSELNFHYSPNTQS